MASQEYLSGTWKKRQGSCQVDRPEDLEELAYPFTWICHDDEWGESCAADAKVYLFMKPPPQLILPQSMGACKLQWAGMPSNRRKATTELPSQSPRKTHRLPPHHLVSITGGFDLCCSHQALSSLVPPPVIPSSSLSPPSISASLRISSPYPAQHSLRSSNQYPLIPQTKFAQPLRWRGLCWSRAHDKD